MSSRGRHTLRTVFQTGPLPKGTSPVTQSQGARTMLCSGQGALLSCPVSSSPTRPAEITHGIPVSRLCPAPAGASPCLALALNMCGQLRVHLVVAVLVEPLVEKACLLSPAGLDGPEPDLKISLAAIDPTGTGPRIRESPLFQADAIRVRVSFLDFVAEYDSVCSVVTEHLSATAFDFRS